MYQIEPRLFEELIEKCMKKMGMHTELTKQTRDGGIDIIAFEDTKFTKNHYIIECKRYNPDHKVGISYVQRLYGVKQDIKATKAFLVTSSSFTSPALEFEKLHQWEMELKAGKDVEKWLNTYWGKK
jgi:restriction system protein